MDTLWDPVVIAAPAPRLQGEYRRFIARMAPRIAVCFAARLREQGHSAVDVRIHDLSTHGFQADSIYRLHVDTVVWLQLPGLAPLAAHVRWFRAHRIGCMFETPLHLAVRDRVIAAAARG